MANEPNNLHIGNYRVISELSRGAFGRVYLAQHAFLMNRTVAIKLLHATLLGSPEEHQSFLQEAQFLEQLKHRYILPIVDVGIDNGIPYLVSEYAPNGSLRGHLSRQAPNLLPLQESLTILTQIGQALQFAHQKQVIHRDIKPENILFNMKYEALLADFGIATTLTTASVKHVDNAGTPPYMAPEQFQGTVSKESDQYSLACIAYELVTGRQPFIASNVYALGFKHLMENPTPPTQLNRYLSPATERVILKAMAKQRIDRYPDTRAFILALQESVALQAESVIPTGQTYVFPLASADVVMTGQGDTGLKRYADISTDGQGTGKPGQLSGIAPRPDELTTYVSDGGHTVSRGSGRIDSEPPTPFWQGFSDTPRQPAHAQDQGPVTPAPPQPVYLPTDHRTITLRDNPQRINPRQAGRKWLLVAVACIVVFGSGTGLLALIDPAILPWHVAATPSPVSLTTVTVGPEGSGTAMPTRTKLPNTATAKPRVTTRPTTQKGTSTPVVTATATSLPPGSTATKVPGPPPTHTPTPPPAQSEQLMVPFAYGNTGKQTKYSYSGKVTITVSGSGVANQTAQSDAFYQFTDNSGNPLNPPVNTACYVLWINGSSAASYLPSVPNYNPSHAYTFFINAPGGSINFAECDNADQTNNTGTYTITIQAG